ncbi:7939_t:CDS:2 [Cetraspora pellucida]|uniref:7939_t:CDS:1 n=1 Tax=Cetraspora pellucida TaxID=1433469 RepID=A0ACA9NXB0_9GLOM|nr:7939_t:CDS:2 [Cetraspora pellucida]
MLCYADTIVRIKCVRKNEKSDGNLLVVWAIGVYPVEHEDNEVEMVLFVPANYNERDRETQAVFEKDCFYSVCGKIVPSHYERVKRPKMTVSISTGLSILKKGDDSNKCSLRVSLVVVPQESSQVILNDENAIFGVSISDYISQEFNFVVKIVFQHLNPRFVHLKNTVCPQELLIFVVGQLEVIENDFYIYAKDINFINIQHLFKQKGTDRSSFYNSSEIVNITRSKLIATHRNVIKSLKEGSKVNESVDLNNSVDNDELDSSLGSSSKRVRVESSDESVKDFDDGEKNNAQIEEADVRNTQCNEKAGVAGEKKKYHKSSRGNKKGKNHVGRSLRSTSQLYERDGEDTNSENE